MVTYILRLLLKFIRILINLLKMDQEIMIRKFIKQNKPTLMPEPIKNSEIGVTIDTANHYKSLKD